MKTIKSVTKGDVMMGTVKTLRIVDRTYLKNPACYTVAINNTIQGNYATIEEAHQRFNQLQETFF